eukprot:UN27505
MSELTMCQMIDEELWLSFRDGYEVGLSAGPENPNVLKTILDKIWLFWGELRSLKKIKHARFIDRDQATLNNLPKLPDLTPEEHALNAFKSYCSFNQHNCGIQLESLKSQLEHHNKIHNAKKQNDGGGKLDNNGNLKFLLDPRTINGQHLTRYLLIAFYYSPLLYGICIADYKLDESSYEILLECCK